MKITESGYVPPVRTTETLEEVVRELRRALDGHAGRPTPHPVVAKLAARLALETSGFRVVYCHNVGFVPATGQEREPVTGELLDHTVVEGERLRAYPRLSEGVEDWFTFWGVEDSREEVKAWTDPFVSARSYGLCVAASRAPSLEGPACDPELYASGLQRLFDRIVPLLPGISEGRRFDESHTLPTPFGPAELRAIEIAEGSTTLEAMSRHFRRGRRG